MIISRTPFRVSFVGGGTDYPQWYREHGGAVLATAINHYCYINCRYLPPFFDHKYRIVYSQLENVKHIHEINHPAVRAVLDYLGFHEKGLEIHYDADLPARSGLGSSSAFTVGLCHALKALKGEYISTENLAKAAIHIEQNIIKEAVGSQDQTLAACGGFNRVDFLTNGEIKLTPVVANSARIQSFQNHLMLFFTGFSRYASEIAQSKINNFSKKEQVLHAMREMVDEALLILQNNNTSIDEFGKLLDEGWRYKRGLSEKVSTDKIDQMYETAKKAGAIGGKLLGAGGGGFMLLFVKPEQQVKVRESLSSLLHIPFKFEPEGSRIVLYQPDE
ncbi:MAG: kinase, partial [Gammaproteobacteria bacterium RIFCSPLOWO2_02_FULL_42_9]